MAGWPRHKKVEIVQIFGQDNLAFHYVIASRGSSYHRVNTKKKKIIASSIRLKLLGKETEVMKIVQNQKIELEVARWSAPIRMIAPGRGLRSRHLQC